MHRSSTFPRSATALALLLGLGAPALTACARAKPAPAGPAGSAKLAAKATHTAKATLASSAEKTPEAAAVALCNALHELPTKRRAACCSESPIAVYGDECVRLLSAAVRAGKVRVDADGVERCAARVDEATRGCDWVAPALAAAPAECAAAVSGLVPEGGRCASSLECSGALHCAGQGASTPGVCKPPQPLGAGCGTSVDSLATYLSLRAVERRKPACDAFCALTTHRCEPKPAAGAPCRASVNCAPDQTCARGRCEALEHPERSSLSRPGETCATDLDCAAGGCVTESDGARRCAKKCASELASLGGASRLGALKLGAP